MNYTQKLVLSMLVPTIMVAGAGSTVVAGAMWLHAQAEVQSGATILSYLKMGAIGTAILTILCVVTCVGFTIWIRKTALITLGGDPSLAQAVMTQMADGKLAIPKTEAAAGSLMHSLARLAETMRKAFSEIRDATQTIEVASGEIAAGNHDLSNRTELTARNLQTTSENMRQLVKRVNKSVEAARHANEQAQAAANVADRGGTVVGRVVSKMDEINQSSQRIGDIIGVIDSIAFQTNILALNAAVEAARAGDHGRGFAVVASEVRSLAGRSAEAAKEIRTLISTSVDCIQSGTQYVNEAGNTMKQIVGTVNQVSAIIHTIADTSNEQASGIIEIDAAIAELDRMTQQNAALVEQSAAAAESLKGQTQLLSHAVGIFQVAS